MFKLIGCLLAFIKELKNKNDFILFKISERCYLMLKYNM